MPDGFDVFLRCSVKPTDLPSYAGRRGAWRDRPLVDEEVIGSLDLDADSLGDLGRSEMPDIRGHDDLGFRLERRGNDVAVLGCRGAKGQLPQP